MIYFDHAATTPCSKEVVEAMLPYFYEKFGNSSSIYKIGREARSAVEDSRQKIAKILGAENQNEIIFTSGATESNNLAIKGVVESVAKTIGGPPHVITTQIEHHCVLDVVKYLEKTFGVEVTYLSVSKDGLIDAKELEKSIKEKTALISVMMGNNEMGALQPIAEIGKIIKKIKAQRQKDGNKTPLIFHTDAVQVFAFESVDVKDLGVDMLSLTAHKFYGPKGIGVLYARNGVSFAPQQLGGAQERGRRAGTENIPYIVGMANAMDLADSQRKDYRQKTQKITDYLIERVKKEIPNTELIGPEEKEKRLPHIASFLFKGVEGESVLINLDMLGIACSSGSACTSGSLKPSHVTKSMGYGDLEAHGAIRFSLGKLNKKEDVDKLMEHLPGIINKLRVISPITVENSNSGTDSD
ncbi:MAG: cysteine desulfurase family protein [Patescibacteria group bacterium]|nr:cysteine desulfurase family protein [Patescibacteria group bacterium]